MTRALLVLSTAAAVLASAAGAAGPVIDESAFRYERLLKRHGTGPDVIEPDARLFAHARPELADLRIVTRDGRQVAWRPLPESPSASGKDLTVLYRGAQGGKAVALLDAGRTRPTLDELELDIAGSNFVGRAEVLASDDRTTFTKLSSTVVYDITGARTSRSASVVFPASSARYYLVRVSGVEGVTGAAGAVATPRARRLVEPVVEQTTVRQRPGKTVVTLDLGFRRVPVDRLRITASTPIYDRAIEVRESVDGRAWRQTGSGWIHRLPDSVAQEVDVATLSRYVRVAIANGDDAPLAGIRVTPLADSRAILVSGGDPGTLRLLYGSTSVGWPDYEFARLPVQALELDAARPATLGAEGRVTASIPAPDVETFFEQHDWLVPALLGLAALGVGAAGLLAALKPRRPTGTRGAPTA